MNPMHVVAIAGRSDAVEILTIMLENGFDVNAQTRSGEDTVLHLIVEHVEVKEAFPLVLKILDYQPDLKIRNRVSQASLFQNWIIANESLKF